MQTIRTDSLESALNQAGLVPPSSAELAAGCFTRFDDPEGRRGNKSCWVHPFRDGRGAVFGNWRTDQTYTWQMHLEGQVSSATELQRFRAQAAAARAEASQIREQDYKAAAEQATDMWDQAQAGDHPYLSRKAVKAHGTRVHGDSLLVPVLDSTGTVQSLQNILPDGAKRFFPGGRVSGGRFWIGVPGRTLVIAEGFATAAAIHEATGLPVCVAFNAGNLLAVAKDLRASYPAAQIILAADNDVRDDGKPNTGLIKAQEAAEAVAGTVAPPEMNRSACDWWDVWHERGDAPLKAAFTPQTRFRLLRREDLHKLPELEWRIDGVLPLTGIGLVIGQSGAGKSFVVIDMLARVSLGMPWFEHGVRPCNTVYCALEGRAGIRRRIEAWESFNGEELPDRFSVVVDSLKLTEPGDVHELARAVLDAGGHGGLIVIDTLAQSASGVDENSSADMGSLIDAMQRLQAMTGGLVLAVHHMGKDTTRGARGHSSLYAACDVVLAVAKSSAGAAVSTESCDGGKSKDAEPVSHAFELTRVVLRELEGGDQIAGACVLAGGPAQVARNLKAPKGANARVVWDKLGVMLRDAGDRRPAGAPAALPEGRPAVRLDDALQVIATHLPVDPRRQNERCRAAITSLMNCGLVEHMEGWLWVK